MVYTVEQALKQNLYQDSILVSLQPKTVCIHPGHVKLIEFAKTLGSKVNVQITRSHPQFLMFSMDGKARKLDDRNIITEIRSIEKLGVNVIVKRYKASSLENPIPRIKELTGFFVLKDLKDIPALKDIEIPDFKVGTCKRALIEYVMIPRDLGIKTLVRGPEFENFIVRAVGKETKYPRPPITIFPEMVKDEFGLTYRTTIHISDEQIGLLREMIKSNAGKIIYETIFDGRKFQLVEYVIPREGWGSDKVEETNYAKLE